MSAGRADSGVWWLVNSRNALMLKTKPSGVRWSQRQAFRPWQRVVAGIDLDQREARRVAQPGLGVGGHGRRIEAAAGQQRGIGPGGSAGEDAHGGQGRLRARKRGRGGRAGRGDGRHGAPGKGAGRSGHRVMIAGYMNSCLACARPGRSRLPGRGRAWDCCHSPPMSDTQSPSSSAPQDRPDPWRTSTPPSARRWNSAARPGPARAAARTARCW